MNISRPMFRESLPLVMPMVVNNYAIRLITKPKFLWHNHYVATKPEEWRAADYRYAPYVTYTSPQTAQVGLTEAQLKERGIPYEVSILGYSETAKGTALGYKDPDEAL